MQSHQRGTRNLTLKVAILASGYTQRRLSKKARIEETRFSKIINGVCPPTKTEKRRLAKLLNRTELELFGGVAA